MDKIDIKISNKNIDYIRAVNFMEHRVNKILNKEEKEMLWFLNHNHIYTCGTSSKDNEIINKTKIPIIKTNRGGKTTYHGPGQRIVYMMIDLNKRKKDIRKFVRSIEKSIILFLQEYEIEAKTFPERVGIWVIKSNNKKFIKEKKIGAIGLRVKKWITYHGLSFNINPELDYYNDINSCGIKNYSQTSLLDLNIKINNKEFDKKFKKYFYQELNKL